MILCEGLEVLFSLVDFPDTIYRVLCVRYIFLFYLGWLWVKQGIRINGFTIAISILSLASILYFEYLSINDEPWIYATSWKYHRWPCYYFVANGFVAFLYFTWIKIKRYGTIKKIIEILSTASYEIFLLQMMLIFVLKLDAFSFIPNELLKYSLWILVVWSCSIIGGKMLSNTLKTITH